MSQCNLKVKELSPILPSHIWDRKIKNTWFACLYFRKYTICNSTEYIGWNTITKTPFHPIADFTCTITKSIRTDYTVCDTLCQDSFTFLYEQGIKTWVTITGRGYGYFTQWSLSYFCILSLRLNHLTFFYQVSIHFTFLSSFNILSKCKSTVFT